MPSKTGLISRSLTGRTKVVLLGGLALLLAIAGVRPARGQRSNPFVAQIPVVQDWSHHHLLFSRPGDLLQALELQQEPRYWHQWFRRNAVTPATGGPVAMAMRSSPVAILEAEGERGGRDRGRTALKADWAMSLTAGGTAGAAQFPAKFTFDINATPSCGLDYVAFNTSLTGTTAPSVIAFNNLYATQGSVGGACNVNGPSVYWSYKTGSSATGLVRTSIVVSGLGDKIAYVESNTGAGGTHAMLHILKWKSGEGTLLAPVAPTTTLTAGQNWTTNCPAANSCIASFTFSSGNDTLSSPFYDYLNDALYVGDASGAVHKFTGVFLGTPAEAGAPWPITVHTGHVLSSPVYDSVTKNIFVGDDVSQLSYIRESGSSSGACGAGAPPCFGTPSITLLGGASASTVDGPMVDSTNGTVFWFSEANQTGHTTCSDGTAGPCFGMLTQTTTALASPVYVNVGGTDTPTTQVNEQLHTGAFDDAYINSAKGATTGFLYIAGKEPNHGNRRGLMRIGFSAAGVMNATLDGAIANHWVEIMSTPDFECSPLSEIKNGTDRIYVSVPGTGDFTCGAGITSCVYSFATGAITSATTPAKTAPASGGGSGMVVDNVGAGAQESNIYFTFLSNSTAAIPCDHVGVGCAVKLTQANLN